MAVDKGLNPFFEVQLCLEVVDVVDVREMRSWSWSSSLEFDGVVLSENMRFFMDPFFRLSVTKGI